MMFGFIQMKYDTLRSLFQPSILTDRRAIDRAAWLDHSSFLAVYVRFALIGTEIRAPRKTVATRQEPCARL
jgi:hypothetical protein